MRRVPVALLFLLALIVSLAPSATGAGGGVVISQVYGGGGNAGATYANDFLELFNPGASSVDLSGWTIQYATSAGTSWQATPLTGSIGAGRYYLVQLASTAAVGAALPTMAAPTTQTIHQLFFILFSYSSLLRFYSQLNWVTSFSPPARSQLL